MPGEVGKGGDHPLPMQKAEWRTYLALERAGPRAGSRGKPAPAPPPWGNGEVAAELPQEDTPSVASLRSLLARRRSASELGQPFGIADLRLVLSLTLSRPAPGPPYRSYPTSGGCDELGILIAARRVQGLPEAGYWAAMDEAGGLSYAAPIDERYEAFEQRACPFLGLSSASPPAVLLLVMADWRRLAARYAHCVLASALWDCGTLLQTISLAATTSEISARICACVQPRLVEAWLHLDCRDVGQVGLLALGGPPSQTA